MPIGRTQDSDQFCDVFKSANGDFITGYSGHGVPLRRLLGVQLVSFNDNDHVDFAEAGLARPNEYRRDGARPRKIPNRLQLGRIEMRSRASPRGRPAKEEIK